MFWTLVKIGLIRKRLRTFLTIMSMFIAFVLYGSLNTLSGLFTGSIEGLSADNIIVMPRYNMLGKLPYSHVNYIETLEGVEEVMYMDFLISDSIESMMEGVAYAVSPNFFDVYDRFEATEQAILALKSNPNATIVGQLMADQKGLKIGDRLNTESSSLNIDGTYNWSFEVVGFYTAKQIKGDELGAIINWPAFDEARMSEKGTLGTIMVKATSPEVGEKISKQIDEQFMNSNTLAQSIRERTSDIGVLKCLGYKDNIIFISVILEAVTICFSAVLMGLLVTALIIPAIEIMSGGILEDTVSISLEIVLGGFLIGLLIALMSAVVPAYQALRLRVVDALREG